MEHEVDISVVLPSHNGQQFIKESIDSVIEQSFEKWELIIVNDGSTDDTLNIIKEYQKKDKRIRIIDNEINMGLPKALNAGFEHSKGRYLTWCSDDNYYYPDALKKMNDYLILNNDKPMVCANYYFLVSGKIEQRFNRYNTKKIYIENSVGACFLYRREVFDLIGGYDEEEFLVEDYEYWLRVLEFCGEIGFIDEPLLVYRLQDKSLTSTRYNEIQNKRFNMLWKKRKWIFDHIKDDRTLCVHFFIDMHKNCHCDEELEREYYKLFPFLKGMKEPDHQKKFIIYGAGRYGAKALQMLNDRVQYFTDSDKQRWGTRYEGIPVISPEEMIANKTMYNIVIAVNNEETVIEIMEFLYQNQVDEYSLLELIH